MINGISETFANLGIFLKYGTKFNGIFYNLVRPSKFQYVFFQKKKKLLCNLSLIFLVQMIKEIEDQTPDLNGESTYSLIIVALNSPQQIRA